MKARRQRGYLLVVAIVIILVIGFIGALLAYMFTGSTGATSNSAQSNAALYIATSGLEVAKRDILVNGVTCGNISGSSYTARPLFNNQGQYTVTGQANTANTTTNGAISSSSTNITLNNAANFAPAGSVMIDSERINYTKISGNTLTNVKRGAAGTVPASHTSAAAVTQNQCTLTAVGGVPTIAAATGKRTLQQILQAVGFGLSGVPGWPSYVTPAVVGLQIVNIPGSASIINSSVTTSSQNFVGSTVIAAGGIVFNGAGSTKVNNGSGGLVKSSYINHLRTDVIQPSPPLPINSSNLFTYFFNASKSTVYAMANKNYNSSNINGVTGATAPLIWVSDLSLSGNKTIGSASYPVILIVNGNLNLSGNVTIHGFVYTMQGFASSTGSTYLDGALASEGAVNLNGNCTISYNPSILYLTQVLNPSLGLTHYVLPPTLAQEIFY